MIVCVWIPVLPPSSNKLYKGSARKIHGKWIQVTNLTPDGRRYRQRAIGILQREGKLATTMLRDHTTYELRLDVFFEKVENKGWPKTKDRYDKVDISNRVKVLEDAIARATGIDDRCNFRLIVEKHCDPDNPGILVTLRPIPEEEVGLTKEQLHERRKRLQEDQQNRAGEAVPSKRARALRPSGDVPRRPRRHPRWPQ